MRRAHVKWCYGVSAMLAALALARLAFFEETLPSHSASRWLDEVQPMSFLKIFRVGDGKNGAKSEGRGTTLRRLMCITGAQTMTELRNVNQFFSVYMEKNLRWSWDQINNFTAAFGLSLIVSGAMVKRMISFLGMRRFTTFCNSTNAMSYLIFSGMGPFSFLLEADAARMWSGLLMAACGGRKRDAVEALIMKHGAEAGLGRGFVSGSLMNFRAIVNMVAPVLLSRIYALGSKRGRPELVFLFGALSSVTAECVWQSLSNVQLGLDRKGHAFKKEDGSERRCTT